MTSRASSPRRLESQNSVKKQENGMDSPLRPGRQPLRAIPESSSSRSSSASEQTETSSPSKPPTPRGKKRAAAVYRQNENIDGNIGSASNTPEKPREKRTTLTRVSKATAPWSSKLPITASLARALQDSLQQTDAANKSWDSDSVGGTPTTSYRTPLIPSTGVGKPGSIEQTSRTFKISGKPPLDSELSRTCFGSSNSSFLQSTPSRSVNRSLRYGATPGSAASVGSSWAPGNGAKSSGSFQFNTGQQISAQQFDFEEDNTFWEDHNVQVILRTRPINASESALKGFSRCIRQENSHSITWIGQPETRFTFDHVAGEHITQENLFRVAGVPMVDNCMAGYNSCMFCYGQTGSGKTHTMLGDIVDLEQRPSGDRGVTPRVFEYLFSKIQKEEDSRTEEHLKYVCKCSFLEIFNEQITDLLEPRSTNLQVREGGNKGVYVENLSEVAVGSVQDVVRLLLLGAANRKVAATNMNRESSRSHSVFTCTIESQWELNSTTNIRFGRLNLVDLAGSERQKTSGAEGERLKEAANINKSLSTLGLVIMILVDVANGKQRHVPYRDSKLTYLLQDSLGGNSKTTMIANISPSSCCALETLSTLKFAQRAKFIRNNAVVNEDASGDMNGLRQEIQELKEELDRIRRQDLPRTPSMHSLASVAQDSVRTGDNNLGMAVIAVDEREHSRCSIDAWEFSKAFSGPRFSNKKLEAMEAVLAGALRREQEAELSQKRQSTEIEHLTRLVKQREDDGQCSKMLLRFREDKLRRLEALSAGSMSADVYLRQENDFLMNELRLIQEKADRNPELTRFAMENIRLLEQLRRFQDFYTGGEREAMVDEISSLRDQLLEALDSKLSLIALTSPQREALAPELAASQREIELLRIETENYRREVEDCRKNLSSILEANSRITKQLDESNSELREVKLKNEVHEVELQKLREQALDAEAIEWGHAQHLELISNLKMKLQQSEDRADREANLRFDLNELLNASSGEAANLLADLQETRGALDAAEMLVCSLQSAESGLSAAQEMAILAQNAVRQIHLETKEIAEDQRLSLKHTEDAVVAACMKELELREELKEAQSLIQKLSSAKDEPMCFSCSVASENERETDILVSKRTVGISQLEQDVKSLDLSFGSGCTHLNTRSRESAKEENIAKLSDETPTTQRKQSSYQEQGKDCILKLNFTLEESHTVEDPGLLKVEPDDTRKDLQDAESIVSDLEGDRILHVLKGNNINPVDLELVQTIRCLQGEIMKLKPQSTSDQPREAATKSSSTELVKDLQGLVWVVQAVLEERKNLVAHNEALLNENDIATKAREERDAATSKLLEHLNEGEHALTDAVHEMQGILDDCLSQPAALDKGRFLEQESVNLQKLDMSTTPSARKDTDKQAGSNDHSDGIMRNFAVCTIMLQWFSDTLAAESSAKNSLRTQNDRAEEDLGNKDCLIKKLEEDITVLQRDWTELESKAVKNQEKLRASNILIKELSRSEEQLKLQTVALAAENKRLTRCMACREMEFSSLQGQIEALEKNLKESHEKDRISTMTLGNLKESLKVLEKQWHLEREQMKERIVTANRELSESQEMKQIFCNALKELDGEIIATEKKCEVTFSELETQWSIARGEMSSHLSLISLDFIEVKSCTEKTYLDLAKTRSLLSAADTAIEQLVDKSSELKDTNKQLLVTQEALQSELSCWEQYSMELQKSSYFVPSPNKDRNAIAISGVRPFSNYFETLKTEVEKVRRECERLRAELFDKDTALLSVQLELSATIASSREGEIELACLVDERSDLKLQLTSISKALVNAQDEVRCRDVELKTFECELHKVMDVLKITEEKMDESSLEWRKQIEKLKAEREDAKLCASENSTEAIMLRKQFEDGQATLKEAEILVNALVQANEIAKRDVLIWRSRGEKITLQSSEVLSMIDEEVSVTIDHVEKHLQDLGSDIHGMKRLLTSICSERAAGFDLEFKEFMKIQISEIESATDGVHMKLAKLNAKVTDLEQREQQSVMENEALQVSLDRTLDLLVGSQAALEDALQSMGVQHKGYVTTKDELQGALASLAGKSAYISELTFECDHLSKRNQELERSLTETCEELRMNVANSKELEMENLTLVEASEMLQVGNKHLRDQVRQLEISLADAMRMKQVVEMEVISFRQQKDSYEHEIRKFEVDLADSHNAVNAAAAKHLETEVTLHALISDLENSQNEVVCIQGSLDEAIIEVNDLRLLAHELGEREVLLLAQAETQKNLLESTSEKFVRSEAEFLEAVEILATMLESTSSELHVAETLRADLEKNNIKFSSSLASLQVTASQLGQEKGFLSVRVSALEEDKKILLDRLELQSKQLCMQSLEASAASSAQELQLDILKTIIESTSREVQEKDHMIFSLQEKLEQSGTRCLALDESKKDLLGRLEMQRLELCMQSQEASAASTAHQTELEILKTIMESASWKLQEKDHMIFVLEEKLEQSSAHCLALNEIKKDLMERFEIQRLELCQQSQEASAALAAHQLELEALKTTMEIELQDKHEMMASLREKLEESGARCLALDESKKDLLERLEIQRLEHCQQSQEASAASTAHQTELETLKTTMEIELQAKHEMMVSLREKLEQSGARCLALDESKKDLVERLEIQRQELCKQSQETSAATNAHQTELEILKTVIESASWKLQEKDHMIFVLEEKLEQSSAHCLALDEIKKDLLERFEIQRLELCKQSQEASAAFTAHQTELEILKTTMEIDLQEKHEMMVSLREKLEQSGARCLALDESKKDLLERFEIQSLELCKESQEASAATTAHQTELEILKTIMESASWKLQEKDHMIFVLEEKLEQSSAHCLALDENKKDLLERLEIQRLELCTQSQQASAAFTAHQTELEILKTTVEIELQHKHEMIVSLREKLEQSGTRCLALDESKKDLLGRLEMQRLELCMQSQEASAASTAHQTELEILKTIMESASWKLQEKDHMIFVLEEKLEQSSAHCLALNEIKKDLMERFEIQRLELCQQSQEASAALAAHQLELEALKTTIKNELQDKHEMMASLREKLEESGARCLALDESKKDLLGRLEMQRLELCMQSQGASAASTAHQTELETLKTTMEIELQAKHEMMVSLREKLEQSGARCVTLDENKNDLVERLEIQRQELCQQSQEADAASTAHLVELEILRTIIDSASKELLEKDHITSSLLDNLQESSAETLKLLNSFEISVFASAQMEHERDEILETARNLETEKRVLKDEVNIKSRSCADLERKILRLQTKVQESSTASWKLKLELEILTTMLESAVQESREKDAMASDLENLLSQSQLQNAEMLQSSQEVVNHFSLFQSQLDACFQQNKELERNKLVLTAEVYSLSQEIANLKELRQASEKSLEEFRTSFAQLRKQKDEEVGLLSDEVEKLKSQEAAMEVDLWDWEQRCQDTEIQLEEKVSELMVLRGKLLATQEECKQQLELVYEALRECQRRTEEMDSERRDLINEIEEGCSVVADLQAKLQIRESEMEEHFSRHSIEQEALEALENEKSELESIVKHLSAEVVANQQRATAAENMQVETRLEMEALARDLEQKNELLQNLEADLNLLQESAFQELRLNQELDSLRLTTDLLQQEVNMQKERRTRLEIEIAQVTEEIVQTRNNAGTWKAKACELETELDKKRQTIESLEDELRMAEQNMANTLEEVTVDLKEVENERDRLQIEVLELTEQLEMTHTMVEERDAVVSELHQAGELSRTHAKEKEDEAKLLTRSVHELESTVYALENQLGLLKREAERQRLLREDIEMESQKLSNHIFVTESALEESNTRNAEELKHAISALQETERKVEDKESEISHFRRKLENLEVASKDKDVQINDAMAQISDLLLAAEVQKADYQQKLKRLESQMERSKSVNWEVLSGCTVPNSIEVGTEIVFFDANPAQESFSRRDITHISCQSRINELEELASSRQKEVFTLHTRLAEAESMTHDVLRDLLGVKSEMTNVVSMLDHQQIKQLAETACRKNVEAEEMETELSSLRSQLNAYIEERESWVEEINLRQCEIGTARVAAENLRQKEQMLTDEIEKFRIENINHQEKISELEMEIRRLPSSQQSFYQQINHHAKIKEENQALKLTNEELSKELRRTELLHAGMHDELVRYKSVEPKSTSPSFDEERLHLRHLLQEAENSRAEAAQKLSSLCSALMQAAGLSVSETVDVPGAMDALNLLENRLRTTELEPSDSKHKIKFTGDRRRRTDVRAKDSPLRSISNFTDLLQRASSGSPAPR